VDIYALGVMTHEMISGRDPFDGATPTAVMMKRLGGPPDPVTAVRPDVPEAIAAAITKCLAADPAERFQNTNELIAALRGEARVEAPAVRPSPTRARRFSPIAAAVVGVTALAAVAVVGWWMTARRSKADSPVQLAAATPPADAGLVTIPAAAYVIGADAGPKESRPRHRVQLGAFQIERTEVTTADYERFVIATKAPAPWTDARPDGTLPVTRVPWGDAANYCAWKYQKGGRLPTEFEWEAAARGTAGRAYPYGDAAVPAAVNTASAKRSGPVPVGSFPRGATPEGLQDMSGNVWEWTSSPMRAYPGAPAMADSMSAYRVIRGGAFDTNDSNATAWTRGYLNAGATSAELPNTGFRCVVSP
jgi:formylglycine-generating enzyme required for sulfatase activity